jgi:hypothetical protein
MQIDVLGLLTKEASTLKHVVAEAVRHEGAKPDFSSCP